MKKTWEYVPLKDLCNNFRQDIVDGPFGSNLKRSDYKTTGIPVLKIQNVKPFQIVLKKMDYVDIDKYNELKRHSYGKGDIILTKLGDPLGASAIVDEIDDGLIVADLVRIRAQKVNTKYLCYHLNSPKTNDFINSLQKGTTRPRVKIENVRDLPIYYPPLPEQQRIVAILDESFAALASAKENAEKNLVNARELFESVLERMFANTGDEWEEKKLGEVTEVQSGGTPLRSTKEYWNGDIAWYSSGELNNLYTNEPVRKITKLGLNNSNAKKFPKGSLLMGMYDTAALKMSILDREAAFNQAIAGAKTNNQIDLKFVMYAINAIKPEILNQRRGVRQKNLSLEKIKNIPIVTPPLAEQRAIVARLEALSAETQKLEGVYRQKLAALEELKKSVLAKAFAGEL